MCRPATCKQCAKQTWAGCGQHVDAVLANVPTSQRCVCRAEQSNAPAPAAGRGWWRFGRT